MSTHLSYNNLLLSMLATIVVFLFTSSYSPAARAAVTEIYQPNQAAPITLAWWGGGYRGGYRGGWNRGYGYRYRGGWNRGYGYGCTRSCFRNGWGRVVCRCI